MKKVFITLLVLTLAGMAFGAQNSNTKRVAKPKPVKVDCATVTDAQITDDVKARLAKAPSLKDLTINVATAAGAVTLTGTAKKPTQKGTATRVAKAAMCVKSVNNQMTVEKSTTAAPTRKSKTANKNM